MPTFHFLVVAPAVLAAAPNCSGHGTFSIWHSLFGCLCDDGWNGRDCSTPLCDLPCENGGTCAAPNKCECSAGFQGETCTDRSCLDDCSGHGTCTNGTCSCNHLWTGPSCAEPACLNDCSGHGKCQRNVCVCDEGWRSVDCSIIECPRDCSAHGDCSPNGTCACWAGTLLAMRMLPCLLPSFRAHPA